MSRLSKVTVVTVNYDNLDDLIKTLDSADNQKVMVFKGCKDEYR